jgi:hypothetical protein
LRRVWVRVGVRVRVKVRVRVRVREFFWVLRSVFEKRSG